MCLTLLPELRLLLTPGGIEARNVTSFGKQAPGEARIPLAQSSSCWKADLGWFVLMGSPGMWPDGQLLTAGGPGDAHLILVIKSFLGLQTIISLNYSCH
jgi:hypothetical protein